MNLAINGRFLAASVTGVQRFSREVLRHIAPQADVTLFVPANATVPDDFSGPVVRGARRGQLWEQTELPVALTRAAVDVVLHPANTAPARTSRSEGAEPDGRGAASVVVVHDAFPLSNPEWFTRRFALWQKHAIAPALRRAERLLTVSEWSKSQLAKELGVPLDHISVVPQGLAPFDTPAAPEEVERVRARHHLPEKYLIAFGGRDPRKNIRFLIPVADALAELQPDASIVIVGDAHPRVHRADERIATRPNLRVLGHVDASDAHPLMTGASALCFPSLAEGFGRPPLEALACGTPAVVGPYGCAQEVLAGAGSILPWEPRVWAETLDQLLRDPLARRRALAQAEPLKKRYTWEASAAAVLRACREVVEGRLRERDANPVRGSISAISPELRP